MFATVMFLALAAGNGPPADAAPLSGRSCAKTTFETALIGTDGKRAPLVDEANRYFADVATPLQTVAARPREPVIPADAETASMTLSTAFCHDADAQPPPLPPCTGSCDPATTPIFDQQYPHASATFRSCGGGVERRRDFRREEGGGWQLVGVHDKAVEACPPVASPPSSEVSP